VEKTRGGIVTLKVQKKGGRKEIVGTGVIIDERGYVVTNQHVIEHASNIAVHLADETELPGQITAESAPHDLAVVRIRTDIKLQVLPLGPASDLMVGETVIAVGHPFGYTNTVSTGIISALGREITMPGGEVLRGLIQTNASINPGNSGGPLLNINGEVIGLNVALREGAQGIAFALNADVVQRSLSDMLSARKISGVRHGLVCRETVADQGAARQRVIVHAAAGGLKVGDEIVRVGERAVSNRFDVERAFWSYKADDRVPVTFRRAGKESVIAVKVAGEREQVEQATPDPGRKQAAGR
jgi:serine protease Do